MEELLIGMINKHNKSVTLKVKIISSGCNAKTITEISEFYVGANSKTKIVFDKTHYFGNKNNYRYKSVSLISKRFNWLKTLFKDKT